MLVSERVSEETPGSLRTPERSSSNSLFGQAPLGALFHQGPREQGAKGDLKLKLCQGAITAGFEQRTPRYSADRRARQPSTAGTPSGERPESPF